MRSAQRGRVLSCVRNSKSQISTGHRESLHILYFTFTFTSHSQSRRSEPYIIMPSAPLNTPDRHFANVAAHLKLCLLVLKLTFEPTEKTSTSRDLSVSATYVMERKKNHAQCHIRGAVESFHGRPHCKHIGSAQQRSWSEIRAVTRAQQERKK